MAAISTTKKSWRKTVSLIMPWVEVSNCRGNDQSLRSAVTKMQSHCCLKEVYHVAMRERCFPCSHEDQWKRLFEPVLVDCWAEARIQPHCRIIWREFTRKPVRSSRPCRVFG